MSNTTESSDLSREQQMVGPSKGAAEHALASADDWGIKGLAIEPGEIERSRRERPKKFEALPAAASTMFEDLGMELIVGSNDLRPAYWLEDGAARSRAVCKIEAAGVDYKGRTGSWSGTGFLVAPGILCTNHHVLNSKDVASRGRALFDFAALGDGSIRPVSTFRLRPDLLFWTSPVVQADGTGGLDVTFVAVEGDPGTTFGNLPLLRQAFSVGSTDKLNIIQHPSGRLKEVAIRDNTVVWQDARVVRYQSDTEPGSSGAPVFNDGWELVALHHASKDDKSNEGIKFSAIATALEQDSQRGVADAKRLFGLFRGTDELMGFFGSLGRVAPSNSGGMERVADTYAGEDQDVDIGSWNIEWFNKHWQDKIDSVARIVIEMNLDVWIFVESSLEATEALADHLKVKYKAKSWKVLASQDAPSERQITTVMWNESTVGVRARAWPDKVDRWFKVDSRAFGDLDLEAVHGKVFDRYPALYEVSTKLGGAAATFNLVPIHLKAMSEGSLRRQMAARLLAAAVAELAKDENFDGDWIIAGDANATLASGDLDALSDAGLKPLTATDADDNQITYVKSPYKSLIDHMFVSPNLVPSDSDFVIVALDRKIDRFLDISDHRPILMRLAGKVAGPAGVDTPPSFLTDDELRRLSRGMSRPTRGPGPVRGGGRPPSGGHGVYYDAAADGAARAEYWKDVTPGSAGFTAAVSARLERSHTRRLDYNPAKNVYPWVDVRPNGKVRSIYSEFEAAPEFFIQADQEVDRLRTEARSALEAGGILEAANLETLLEAQFQYNCEHVVPQSWFSKKEPMRGDLHHLFACEPRCNSFRSNFPLAQHDLERTMEHCGRLEDDTFEPNGGKGAVARATLYFMLRYPGAIGRRYAGQRLETLLRWHEQHAPDEYERHRNGAIFALQGNRNPLIDFPGWASRLQFAR